MINVRGKTQNSLGDETKNNIIVFQATDYVCIILPYSLFVGFLGYVLIYTAIIKFK